MNSKLPEFLGLEARRIWDAREHNCGLWLADWVMMALGVPDPAAELRARCAALGEAAFGKYAPLREVAAICGELGLARTADPLTGDIGVVAVRTASGRRICGAIRGRHGWIVPAGPDTGLSRGLTRPAPEILRCLAAWRIDECPTSSLSSSTPPKPLRHGQRPPRSSAFPSPPSR